MRFVLAFLIVLGACAPIAPQPIATVSPADVAARVAQLNDVGVDPQTYLLVQYALNGERCSDYFVGLAARSRALGLGQAASVAGGTAASGILTATRAFPPAIALAGLGGTLAGALLGSANSATGIPFPVETAHLVRDAQSAFIDAAPMPTSLAQAMLLGDAQGWLCTPPGAAWLASQSIASAQAVATSAPLGAFLGGSTARFAGPRFSVPKIGIAHQ